MLAACYKTGVACPSLCEIASGPALIVYVEFPITRTLSAVIIDFPDRSYYIRLCASDGTRLTQKEWTNMAENLEPDFTLTGQVVDGKIVLDPFNTDTVSTTDLSGGADAGGSFVAVNAPFDPESVEVELVEAELVEA